MSELKTVGVRDLKNKLSAYLREVRSGVRVLVSDRGAVVAELCEPRLGRVSDQSEDPVLSEWVRTGAMSPARSGKRWIDVSPVRLPEGSSVRLLDEEKQEAPR